MTKLLKYIYKNNYTFLGFGFWEDEIGFNGLNKAPNTAHRNIIHAHIDMANLQSDC